MDQKIIKSELLLPLIEDSYRSEYAEWPRRNLRCSDAGAAADDGDKCERSIYYDMKIPEKKTRLTSGTLVFFDDGKLHESDIRRRLRTVLKSPEKELEDGQTGARGKVDNKVRLRSLDVPEDLKKTLEAEDPILEIKTANEFTFQEMANKGQISQSYYDQIQYYLFLDKKKWAIVLIKNRNSFGPEKGKIPFLEFVVLEDKKRQTEIRAGLFTTLECIDKDIIPPRPFSRESTACSYCRYKRSCWPQDERELEIPDSEVPVEAPNQEMLDSALRLYAKLNKEIKEKEGELKEARVVLERYFKATKEKEVLLDNIKATYSVSQRRVLDREFVLGRLSSAQYIAIASPDKKLMEQAIADRNIDAAILEEALKPGPVACTLRVNVKKIKTERKSTPKKGEKNANQRNHGTKKASQAGTSKAGNKSNKQKRKRVPKRG